MGFPGSSDCKESALQEMRVKSLGQEDPLEKGMATHSSILSWRIPWTAEPGGLQSMGLQRVRHDWVTNTSFHSILSVCFNFILCMFWTQELWMVLGEQTVEREAGRGDRHNPLSDHFLDASKSFTKSKAWNLIQLLIKKGNSLIWTQGHKISIPAAPTSNNSQHLFIA